MTSSRKKILIVTSAHLCRNPRVVKEANALALAGYNVTVVTNSTHAPSLIHDAPILDSAHFKLDLALNLFSSNPFHRLSGLYSRAITRLARFLVSKFKAPIAEALGPIRQLNRKIRDSDFDLCIAHTELGLLAALSALPDRTRLAVDFEDWYSEDLLPEHRSYLPMNLIRQAESTALNQATFVLCPSMAMAKALNKEYGGTAPIVIENTFPLQAISTPTKSTQPTSLLWFSQTIGPGRGLESFIRLWKEIPGDSTLTLLGSASPEYRNMLECEAEEARNRLLFHPLVSTEELPNTIANYDIGLALETNSIPSRDLTITNKLFQYMNAGLAVICTPTQGQQEVLQQMPEAGWILDWNDPDTPSRLKGILDDAESIHRARIAARTLVETTYHWESTQKKLLHCVEQCFETSHP
ncbi:MAG: glycosyltransferase [Verrucomicrobiota bacterium]